MNHLAVSAECFSCCPDCGSLDAVVMYEDCHTSATNHYACAVCGFAWAEPKEFLPPDDAGDHGDVVMH